ncbi:hypothetical protein SeMB42_g02032 [Synchytrium endobioticum]|uniref:Uncharacterized protein n=1 Tax=Synchytrium endobioticum TaxID=286115 RepID=A0A507DHG8_9FUNG|nr:hypothetical protein SeMB42_g02032 [Synchytrium endobioticum]
MFSVDCQCATNRNADGRMTTGLSARDMSKQLLLHLSRQVCFARVPLRVIISSGGTLHALNLRVTCDHAGVFPAD